MYLFIILINYWNYWSYFISDFFNLYFEKHIEIKNLF